MNILRYASRIPVAISLLAFVAVVGVIGLANSPFRVGAAANVCHAAIVLDRSGSVGATNEFTLKTSFSACLSRPDSIATIFNWHFGPSRQTRRRLTTTRRLTGSSALMVTTLHFTPI